MDPLLPTEMNREAVKERRTIQFSVPSAVPTQLDPGQVEMIRRRRPTPATLFRLTDQPSPEDDGTHQWVHGENGALKAKRVNASVYQPPSLKAVQRMAQAYLGTCSGSLEKDFPSSGEESEEGEESQEISPPLAAGFCEDTRPIRSQLGTMAGSKGLSKGHPHHYIPMTLQHGEEEEDEEQEEEDRVKEKGE